MNESQIKLLARMIKSLSVNDRRLLNSLVEYEKDTTNVNIDYYKDLFRSWIYDSRLKHEKGIDCDYLTTPSFWFKEWCNELPHDEREIVLRAKSQIFIKLSKDGRGSTSHRVNGTTAKCIKL